jgi:hypothetical protein
MIYNRCNEHGRFGVFTEINSMEVSPITLNEG